MSAELVPADHSEQAAIRVWNPEQLTILKHQIAKGCSDDEVAFFAQVCRHKNLDPFLGEIVALQRGGKMVIQETVEGLLTIAERSGLYAGYAGPWWCGADEEWHDVWLEREFPAAAKVDVYRRGWDTAATGVARWASNAQFDNRGNLNPIWKDRPDEMLAKCALARALKRAFPKEFARAGITVRDLTDAQIVAVETRAAGLDDDQRHELIAEITDGRTDSSRDLTDDETVAVRQTVARRKPRAAASPSSETRAEPTREGPVEQQATLPADAAAPDWFTTNGWPDGQAEHDQYRADAIHQLKKATPDQQAVFKAWREDNNIPSFAQPHARPQADAISDTLNKLLTPEPAPAGPTSAIDRLYDRVRTRVEALPDSTRKRLTADAAEIGIPPDRNVNQMDQDQVHWVDAWLDQDADADKAGEDDDAPF